MRERDSDLKAREQRATNEALKDTLGRTPGSQRMWGDSRTGPPAGVASHLEPPGTKIVPGRGFADPGKVFSTWQVRPINSLDYTAINQRWVASATDLFGSCVFQVPPNYVATVEAVSWYVINSLTNAIHDDPSLPFNNNLGGGQHIFVELFFDGSPVGLFSTVEPGKTLPQWAAAAFAAPFPVLPAVGIDKPCFFLAPSDTLIELRFSIELLANMVAGFLSFRGTLRETRGLAPNFEVQT